jgi:hypothetical protein
MLQKDAPMGSLPCRLSEFGTDPAPGFTKRCECKQSSTDKPQWSYSSFDDASWPFASALATQGAILWYQDHAKYHSLSSRYYTAGLVTSLVQVISRTPSDPEFGRLLFYLGLERGSMPRPIFYGPIRWTLPP